MNSGSAMTSRDSHELRHIAALRQARSGWPRWKNEATRPEAAQGQRKRAADHLEVRCVQPGR